MSNIYESPQASGTRRQVFQGNDVTERMVAGIGKGQKWAKYIAYMSFFYGVLCVIVLVALAGVLATGAGGFAEFLAGILGEDNVAASTGVIVLAVAFILITVFCAYYFIKMGRAMLRYSRASHELNDSYDFVDLETCYQQFTAFNRYSVYLVVVFVVFFLAVFLIGFAFSGVIN